MEAPGAAPTGVTGLTRFFEGVASKGTGLLTDAEAKANETTGQIKTLSAEAQKKIATKLNALKTGVNNTVSAAVTVEPSPQAGPLGGLPNPTGGRRRRSKKKSKKSSKKSKKKSKKSKSRHSTKKSRRSRKVRFSRRFSLSKSRY